MRVVISLSRITVCARRLFTHSALGATAKERSWPCRHASECVEIDFFQEFGSNSQSIFLKPSRGFRISDYVEEPGRSDIVFPWYLVVRTEWQAEGDTPRARKAQESVRYS